MVIRMPYTVPRQCRRNEPTVPSAMPSGIPSVISILSLEFLRLWRLSAGAEEHWLLGSLDAIERRILMISLLYVPFSVMVYLFGVIRNSLEELSKYTVATCTSEAFTTSQAELCLCILLMCLFLCVVRLTVGGAVIQGGGPVSESQTDEMDEEEDIASVVAHPESAGMNVEGEQVGLEAPVRATVATRLSFSGVGPSTSERVTTGTVVDASARVHDLVLAALSGENETVTGVEVKTTIDPPIREKWEVKKRNRGNKTDDDDTDNESTDDEITDVPRDPDRCRCDRCLRYFADQNALTKHSNADKCKDPRVDGSLSSRAIKMSLEMMAEEDSGVKIHKSPFDSIEEVAPPTFGEVDQLVRETFHHGWALKPAHGKMRGKLLMTDEYEAFFFQLFQRGDQVKGEKMSSAQMHEALKKHIIAADPQMEHPKRVHFIPGISEISAAISRFQQKKTKAAAASQDSSVSITNVPNTGGRGRKKTVLPEAFATALKKTFDEHLEKHGTIATLPVCSAAIQKLDGSDKITQASIKRKYEELVRDMDASNAVPDSVVVEIGRPSS